MRRFSLCILLWTMVGQGAGDPIVSELESRHYWHDTFGAIASLGVGLPMVGGSLAIMLDAGSRPQSAGEQMATFTGLSLGAVASLDGLIRLFRRSGPQYFIENYRNYPDGSPEAYGGRNRAEYLETQLARLAENARHSRTIRAGIDLGISLHYLYFFAVGRGLDVSLYRKTKENYEKLWVPAGITAVVGLLRFILKTPEEKLFDRYKSRSKSAGFDVEVGLHPTAPGMQLAIRF